MPKTITFQSWGLGLDLRKGPSTSDANRLRVLRNAYITNAQTIRQRPGLVKVQDLTPGTVGLFAGLGRLNTVQEGTAGSIVTHPTDGIVRNNALTTDPDRIGLLSVQSSTVFNGFLYVVAGYNFRPSIDAYSNADPELYFDFPGYPTIKGKIRQLKCLHHYLNQTDTRVTDVNCPQFPEITNAQSKIYCAFNDVVRYSKTNDPRDWTAAADAGFLPVGLQAIGSKLVTAVGEYENRLVVFFTDGSQIWILDPDPTLSRLEDKLDIGASLPFGHANMAGDVFFYSPQGVRTITRQASTESLIDSDVGSPIDRQLVAGDFLEYTGLLSRAKYVRSTGQYWLFSGPNAVVFTYSRTSKVSAWSVYSFGINLTDIDELDGKLYVRSGDAVYRLDENALDDGGVPFQVEAETAFVDFKSPGVLKQILSLDAVVDGTVSISHRYDPRSPALETDAITISGDTRPGNTFPVELMTTNLSTVFRAMSTDGPAEVHLVSYGFEKLAAL